MHLGAFVNFFAYYFSLQIKGLRAGSEQAAPRKRNKYPAPVINKPADNILFRVYSNIPKSKNKLASITISILFIPIQRIRENKSPVYRLSRMLQFRKGRTHNQYL